ncbi:putative aspartic-type endopeptidase protein [Lasiodiplodia theobromae]|nr:putative aspartic-type endopeptidase protein [Lasiodiplodia theobromae]
MAFNNDGTGPDGPWAYIIAPVDAPSQTLGFYPSMIEMPMIVNASACQAQSAQCVMPTITAWTGSAAHDLYLNETSDEWDPSEWEDVHGGYVTELMSLEGSLRYTTQRLSLGTVDLDGIAMAVADNVTASFPNGDWYTVGIGYLSLYGGSTFTYDIPSGTRTLSLQLALGWSKGAYASMSFGLHMGSVMHKISGKLFWGGYDRARCISEPITVESNSTFSLADISIGVASGGSAFLNNTSSATEIDGLLQTNGSDSSTSLPLTAQPDPGVPYMYLPGATCAAIAGYLPVTYDAGLALYRWNTSAPEYDDIINSPHHLSFHFHTSGTSGATQSIAIPFALLNLTLDYPITSDPTPYFPCRPYSPSDTSNPAAVVLGRAFLQGAHFAQNWHTGSVWLAQAPGPGYVDEDLKTIQETDTGLTPLPNAQAWNETWADVLTPLNGSTTGDSASGGGTGSGSESDSGSGSSSSGSSESSSDSGLSTGAKAGIGVGVAVGAIALLGLVGALLLRSRRREGAEGGPDPRTGATELPEERSMAYAAVPPQELASAEMQELPADNAIKELQSHPKPHELPARYA